jgi:hypothetical protein
VAPGRRRAPGHARAVRRATARILPGSVELTTADLLARVAEELMAAGITRPDIEWYAVDALRRDRDTALAWHAAERRPEAAR